MTIGMRRYFAFVISRFNYSPTIVGWSIGYWKGDVYYTWFSRWSDQ